MVSIFHPVLLNGLKFYSKGKRSPTLSCGNACGDSSEGSVWRRSSLTSKFPVQQKAHVSFVNKNLGGGGHTFLCIQKAISISQPPDVQGEGTREPQRWDHATVMKDTRLGPSQAPFTSLDGPKI